MCARPVQVTTSHHGYSPSTRRTPFELDEAGDSLPSQLIRTAPGSCRAGGESCRHVPGCRPGCGPYIPRGGHRSLSTATIRARSSTSTAFFAAAMARARSRSLNERGSISRSCSKTAESKQSRSSDIARRSFESPTRLAAGPMPAHVVHASSANSRPSREHRLTPASVSLASLGTRSLRNQQGLRGGSE